MQYEDVFIGVDGGGSKTIAVCHNREGVELGRAQGGPSNLGYSCEKAVTEVHAVIAQALAKARTSFSEPNCRLHVGLGLAGTELSAVTEQFLSACHPFSTILLKSDAHVACLGAHGGGQGAIIIVGTGVRGYQIINGQGQGIAGWGFPHSDEGGGAWLGMEALRYTLQWLDGCCQESPMLAAIFEAFDHDRQYLLDWAHGAGASDYATLAPYVILNLATDDRLAMRLIRLAANYITNIAASLHNKSLGSASLFYCLVGGISAFIEPFLPEWLLRRIIPAAQSPAEGALAMVKNYVAGSGAGVC